MPGLKIMGSFRKKPIVIEAWEWRGESPYLRYPHPAWLQEAWDEGVVHLHPVHRLLLIETSEGTMEAQSGDWIIRGIKGELYPCKPDIFAATYRCSLIMDNDTNTAVLDAPTTPAASEPSVYCAVRVGQANAGRTHGTRAKDRRGDGGEGHRAARGGTNPAGDQKTKTPETTGKGEEIPAVADAADDEPAEAVDGDGETWIDDAVKEFASAMGINEDELASFSSREELDRALRIIDRKAFEEAGKPAESSSPAKEKPAAPAPVESANDPFADLAKFKLKAATDDETGFDPEAIKPLNEFVDATAAAVKRLEAKLASYEQAQQQTAVQNLRTEGHRIAARPRSQGLVRGTGQGSDQRAIGEHREGPRRARHACAGSFVAGRKARSLDGVPSLGRQPCLWRSDCLGGETPTG